MNEVSTSAWRGTRTFFPIFQAALRNTNAESVCVVGAADGKFVAPLLSAGYTVTAVDIDEAALHRGSNELREVDPQSVDMRLTNVHGDFRDLHLPRTFDAAWTSCSWHYSYNAARPLRDFTDALLRSVRPGGLLGVEYMMPVELPHVNAERYLEPGEIWGYLPRHAILWEAYTPIFIEAPHPDHAEHHVHRMGFACIAR